LKIFNAIAKREITETIKPLTYNTVQKVLFHDSNDIVARIMKVREEVMHYITHGYIERTKYLSLLMAILDKMPKKS
jgi:hypothetical protein